MLKYSNNDAKTIVIEMNVDDKRFFLTKGTDVDKISHSHTEPNFFLVSKRSKIDQVRKTDSSISFVF